MEHADIIQRVPAEFIKCLSSTNLAPKVAGKTGMTREVVLTKCNNQCREYGLGPSWEEVASDRQLNPTDRVIETEGEYPPQSTMGSFDCNVARTITVFVRSPYHILCLPHVPYDVGEVLRMRVGCLEWWGSRRAQP
ncbi:hypothetical protein JB92DRAFT_2833395 [Gautieria morchelliformis]|nr:hypothetical protein JB92DRAFT_2833395 [Gautieria morchelliformis]